jgi:hypothetical protein
LPLKKVLITADEWSARRIRRPDWKAVKWTYLDKRDIFSTTVLMSLDRGKSTPTDGEFMGGGRW